MKNLTCKNCGCEIEDILVAWEDEFCSEECEREFYQPDENDIGCAQFHRERDCELTGD